MQLRHCEIVQDKDKLKVDIQATCMKYQTIKQWAYILHDKDDPRPHYHIYLNFGKSSLDTTLVAKWFELGYVDKDGQQKSGEQFVNKVKTRKVSMLQYLTHENESQKFKHVYARSEVIANFDFGAEIDLYNNIGDFDRFSYAQQLQSINELPISEKGVAYSKLRKLWELHCQCEALKSDRSIEVVFICGKGGTGKTYYAKKMLNSLGYDFCVSSASNDPFQDYAGQRAMILDDLRDISFDLADLLKVLDNNTNSSVKSRFNNKVFNGKMIVITSSVPLVYWYPQYRSSRDSLEQLYRRIGSYVELTETTVTVYNEGVGRNGKPQGDGQIFRNEVQDLVHKPVARIKLADVFAKFCDEPDDIPF